MLRIEQKLIHAFHKFVHPEMFCPLKSTEIRCSSCDFSGFYLELWPQTPSTRARVQQQHESCTWIKWWNSLTMWSRSTIRHHIRAGVDRKFVKNEVNYQQKKKRTHLETWKIFCFSMKIFSLISKKFFTEKVCFSNSEMFIFFLTNPEINLKISDFFWSKFSTFQIQMTFCLFL